MIRCALLTCVLVFSILHQVAAQPIRLNWAQDGNRCWFRVDKDYFVVNVQTRQCTPAFDKHRLAKAVSKVLQQKVSSKNSVVEQIGFTESQQQLLLKIRGATWLLKLPEYELITPKNEDPLSHDRRLFLPARNSKAGGASTTIVIHNRLSEPIKVYWVSPSGEKRLYGSIEVDQEWEQHTYIGHAWLLRNTSEEDLGCFIARGNDSWNIDPGALKELRHDTPRRPRAKKRYKSTSPDGKWTCFVQNHNLWIRQDEREIPLTSDGTPDNTFQFSESEVPRVEWSPDSKYLLAFQTKRVPEREVHLIESSPSDQLQPRVKSYTYRKPGDKLPQQTLRLFAMPSKKEIPISNRLFENPWTLRFRGWSESGDCFWLHYNQRGHQMLRELEVTAVDGAVKPIIEESSETFIHYSNPGKLVFKSLGDEEILWASERSGWNHLYRYRRDTGQLLNQMTTGDWNVKRIEKIDPQSKQIWFYAVGVHENQDPYHEHFCRVNYDGSQFQILTDGDGTHQIQFEQEDKFFVDTYSRVDLAPVSELRDSQSGELICELHRDDTATKFGKRRMTERFVAKGRDGKTDIWGIIHWPLEFDPNKKYPVVENIYAGPHDHHVPKAFRPQYRYQHQIADAGMIVVQIDGMGTAWRSKAFHDVCYKNLRDAGFLDRIAWIKAAAAKYPQMDISRVGIYGGSAGGQNAMAALLWHHDFYKVAVADCGCHDNRMDKLWWNEQWMGWPVDGSYVASSNSANAHLLEGNLMLIVGELDHNVDPASTTQVVHQLIKHNKDFEYVLVTGVGHGSAETPWASRKRLNFLKEHLRVNEK
ncbi:DPP IV N-terminal domain-containing protein [Gimesia fumaroli]|uniref:Prolyl tripeptidyl peptidase n=1 Tax=Gimesia fumaroli TaxID=2527976 RepID=A0A518IEM9_9PLAN|nr:DPP IV N-terminal domain-containing protein [Gimesia fumaroli]QDV51561.1 Prolyl tripeptidyl peptidase precursor [Gimesia fumaroli]